MFLIKKIDLIHMLDPIQYEFRFFQNTLADPEPEPKLRYSGSGSTSLLVLADSKDSSLAAVLILS
jgi:hypothetical protein